MIGDHLDPSDDVTDEARRADCGDPRRGSGPRGVERRNGRGADALAALASTEYKFLMAKDSVLAASALATALKEELGNSEELLEVIAVMASSLKCSIDDIFVCMCHLVSEHSCHQDIKSQCLKEDRPTTPDDVLNISQSEIIV